MSINYQDKSLIVTYLQVFLRETLGEYVRRVVPIRRSLKPYYEINNNPLNVTGHYDSETYSSLALYMAYNYPNEGFPYIANLSYGILSFRDYYYQGDITEYATYKGSIVTTLKLSNTQGVNPSTIKSVLYCNSNSSEIIEMKLTSQEDWDKGSSTFVYIYHQELGLLEFRADDSFSYEYHIEVIYDNLVDVISNNIDLSYQDHDSISIPDRIISYIMKEVVSDMSSPEEILRIRKMIYESINYNYGDTIFNYSDDLVDKVVSIQSNFMSKYSYKDLRDYQFEFKGNNFETLALVRPNLLDVKSEGHIDTNDDKEWILLEDTQQFLYRVDLNKFYSRGKFKYDPYYIKEVKSVEVKVNNTSLPCKFILNFSENNKLISIYVNKSDTDIQLSSFEGRSVISYFKIICEFSGNYNFINGRYQFDYPPENDVIIQGKYREFYDVPAQYSDYKITGYVDPTTELIINQGVEISE